MITPPQNGLRGSRITGLGMAVPERVITNSELAKTLDTTDEWIIERTGIKERRVGGTTRSLALEAAQAALESANVDPASLDSVILSTTTPDRIIPATASAVQASLGARCGAFDINAACSGFVYGTVLAHSLLIAGAEKILVIGADTLSRFVDWDDRTTAVLFGDGAGAVVLEATTLEENALLGWHMDCDGDQEDLLFSEIDGCIQMEGKEVFRHAVLVMEESSRRALEQAGLGIDDVDLVIPHQANSRIISTACKRLGLDEAKTVQILSWTGNTSSASIPQALAEAWNQGRLTKGTTLLLVGFGAGMTSASAVMRWSL